MYPALTDFKIEGDSIILLAFANGSEHRVTPETLTSYVSPVDAQRVRAALRMRKNYIRRILPPSAMVIMLVTAIGLGRYDVQQISDRFNHPQTQATALTGSRPVAPTVLPLSQDVAVPAPVSLPLMTSPVTLQEANLSEPTPTQPSVAAVAGPVKVTPTMATPATKVTAPTTPAVATPSQDTKKAAQVSATSKASAASEQSAKKSVTKKPTSSKSPTKK